MKSCNVNGDEATGLVELGWDPFFERGFAPFQAQGLSPARVAREEKDQYLVFGTRGELCAEVTGKLRHETRSRSDFPAVGDWVAIQRPPGADRALIHALLPRKSKFSRKTAWTRTEEQVIAANVDTAFVVAGLNRELNARRIERYLVLVWESGCRPVIVLNKADLCPDVPMRTAEVEASAPGVPVHAISATEKLGLDALKPYLTPGTTVALLGSSGVGKSTLVNSLLGEDRLAVASVRDRDGKGRHITTHRELIPLPSGALLIDNPGMRELQLWGEEQGADETFEDIASLAERCRFRDCRHQEEPGCAVRAALADGRLAADRLRSYRKLKDELQRLAIRQHLHERRVEKQKATVLHPRDTPDAVHDFPSPGALAEDEL